MILLATFFAASVDRAVPAQVTVERIRTPEYSGGPDPELTKKTCEEIGVAWAKSLEAKMPSGMTVTMTCLDISSKTN